MIWVIVATLGLFCVEGGAWGWWRGTKDLADAVERDDRPIGMGRREYQRHLRKRYQRRRILLTFVGFALSGVASFTVLIWMSAPTTAPEPEKRNRRYN